MRDVLARAESTGLLLGVQDGEPGFGRWTLDCLDGGGVPHTGAVTELLEYITDLPTRDISAGEVLLTEGERPGHMLVLVSGHVVIERDGVPFAQIDAPGSVFGEMAAVLDQPASATVRAVGDLRVRVIEDPMEFLTNRPGAALAVLRMTASRLDGLTHYLVDVKQQYADAEGHLGMVDRMIDHLVHHQGPRGRTGSVRDPEGDHDHGDY